MKRLSAVIPVQQLTGEGRVEVVEEKAQVTAK